jgi:hypothetical protein
LLAQGCYIGTGKVKTKGFGIKLERLRDRPESLHVNYCTANERGIYTATYSTSRLDDWMHISHVFHNDNYEPAYGHPLVVGRFLIPSENAFKGQIGEIRIWNGARSRAEIEQYKNVALTGKEPGLAACWTFEQSDGQFAYDISAGGNHARLGSAPGADEADPKWSDLQASSHTSVPAEPETKAVIPTVDNRALLTSGVTVELLGVTYIPVTEELWWRPDGSPLPQGPFDDVSFTPSVDPNWQQFAYYAIAVQIYHAVAVQIQGKPPQEVHVGLLKWDFTDAVYAGTTSAYVSNRHVYYENIHAGVSKFPKAVEKTSLRLGIVSGDWQTIFAGRHYGFYEKGKDTAHVRTPERAGGPFSVIPGEKGLHIEVTYNITDRDFRVVAVDKDGKVHISSRGGSSGTPNLRRTTASFPDLTHEHLQEFRFQVRPYEWVEFKDISLRPGKEAVALAEQRKATKEKELEKWLGQGRERPIREQILILRQSRLDHINEPCVEQTEAISAMRELVRMGGSAVPELTAEIRRAEHWLARSLIAFVLRAIGDEQAVPALIETLGKSNYRGEYGIYVKDDEAANFLLDHQHRTPDEGDRKAHAIIIACPVIEITKALEKTTGHSEGPERFSQEAAETVKQRWQQWYKNKPQ